MNYENEDAVFIGIVIAVAFTFLSIIVTNVCTSIEWKHEAVAHGAAEYVIPSDGARVIWRWKQ